MFCLVELFFNFTYLFHKAKEIGVLSMCSLLRIIDVIMTVLSVYWCT